MKKDYLKAVVIRKIALNLGAIHGRIFGKMAVAIMLFFSKFPTLFLIIALIAIPDE
ncbi:MAG: hypothetical protein J6C07_11625 [Lachnospiraceae bacterium]|nr:hypothetical protein [Lachnospiraceae bacterium]